jgi:hypothetical protein
MTVDAAPDAPAATRSIVAVHRVFEMRRADQAASASITTTSNKLLVLASGSGENATTFQIGMTIKIDGAAVGTSRSATNELNSNKSFVRNAIVANLTPGSHTVSVEPIAGATMGTTDYVDVTVIELGPRGTATPIFDDIAPPYSQTFTAAGGHGVLLAAGSGFLPGTSAGTLGMDLRIDDASVGLLKAYTNENSSHKSFGAAHVVLTPTAASHTLDLTALSGTSIDYNDHGSALWLELGTDATLSQVLDQTVGPAPVSNTFTSSGRQLMILVSGSGFTGAAGLLELTVQLDSTAIGSIKVNSVETFSHKMLVPAVLLAQPSAGTHTLTIATATGTSTDQNDRFNATVIELGP